MAVDRGPLFSLVRTDTFADESDIDYAAGSTVLDHSDEIRLVDYYGEPSAVPAPPTFDDLDIEHEYSGGSRGVEPIAHRMNVTFSCEVTDEVRRRLHRWQEDRVAVRINPGFGARTELAYRPCGSSGDSDLTGRHTLTQHGDAARNLVWDTVAPLGIMRSWTAATDPRIIRTPFGAGQVFERNLTNLANPGYPQDGNLGWTEVDGSSVITTAYEANAFGPSACPHGMRVTGDASTASWLIYRNIPATATGQGLVSGVQWIQGRLPHGAKLSISDASGSTDIDLDDYDTSGWIGIPFQRNATWTGSSQTISLLRASGGDADSCNFVIGPTMLVFDASTVAWPNYAPNWHSPGAARTADYVSASSVAVPQSGSLAVAFWVPTDFDPTGNYFSADLTSHGAGLVPGRMRVIGNTSGVTAEYYYRGSTYAAGNRVAAEIDLAPGRVSVLAATWSATAKKLYLDGTLIDSVVTDANQDSGLTTTTNAQVSSNENGSWPLVLLGYRLDAEVWTDEIAAGISKEMNGNGALEITVPARGRTFYITGIPSNPERRGDRVDWSGALTLEQKDYDADTADITSKEI